MGKLPIYAVLTGDTASFSRRPPDMRAELGAAMVESFEAMNHAFDGGFPLAIDVLPDGGWQMLTPRPQIALRAALYFRAELRARMGPFNVDTRVAIGAGAVEVSPRRAVSEGKGPAYHRSERALETMHRTRRLGLRLEDRDLGPGFDEMLGLVDYVASCWTDKQALAVTGALQDWTQQRIADHWDRVADQTVTQQTVAQHLQRAGWHAVAPALELLEGLLA